MVDCSGQEFNDIARLGEPTNPKFAHRFLLSYKKMLTCSGDRVPTVRRNAQQDGTARVAHQQLQEKRTMKVQQANRLACLKKRIGLSCAYRPLTSQTLQGTTKRAHQLGLAAGNRIWVVDPWSPRRTGAMVS